MRSLPVVPLVVLVLAASASAAPKKAPPSPQLAAALALINAPPLSAEAAKAVLAPLPPPVSVPESADGSSPVDTPVFYNEKAGRVEFCRSCFAGADAFTPWFTETLTAMAQFEALTAEIGRRYPVAENDDGFHAYPARRAAASVLVWGYAVDRLHPGFIDRVRAAVNDPKSSKLVPGTTWRMLTDTGEQALLKTLPSDGMGAIEESSRDVLVFLLAGVLQASTPGGAARAFYAVQGQLDDC